MGGTVFLFDVDNTLLDNDRAKADLDKGIRDLLGDERADSFWEIYEQVRQESDVVNIPRTLERFAERFPAEANFPYVATMVFCFPYERYLYSGAEDTLDTCADLGTAAIVSDGDPVFQAAKIARSGLAKAVDCNLIIFAHKVDHIPEIMERFPGEHHVLVDDKADILAAFKRQLGNRVTTIHVLQGHYADEPADIPPDVTVSSIAEVAAVVETGIPHA